MQLIPTSVTSKETSGSLETWVAQATEMVPRPLLEGLLVSRDFLLLREDSNRSGASAGVCWPAAPPEPSPVAPSARMAPQETALPGHTSGGRAGSSLVLSSEAATSWCDPRPARLHWHPRRPSSDHAGRAAVSPKRLLGSITHLQGHQEPLDGTTQPQRPWRTQLCLETQASQPTKPLSFGPQLA